MEKCQITGVCIVKSIAMHTTMHVSQYGTDPDIYPDSIKNNISLFLFIMT